MMLLTVASGLIESFANITIQQLVRHSHLNYIAIAVHRDATTRSYQLTRYIGFDARFPNQNQTKHCWQNYVDYHKCILAKGEDFAPCRQVKAFVQKLA